MQIIYYIFMALTIILTSSILLFLKFVKKYDFNNEKFKKAIRCLAFIYFILMFLNLFLPDGFAVAKDEEFLKNSNSFYENTIRWLNATSIIAITINAFFNNKYINKVAVYFCIPITLIYTFSYETIIASLTDMSGRGVNTIRFLSESVKLFMINDIFRTIILGLLNSFQFVVLMFIMFRSLKDLVFNKKEVINFILITLGIILLSLSSYTFQYYFNYTSYIFERFSLTHLIVILFMIAETLFLYVVFKNKNSEIKHLMLVTLSISLLFQYSQVYTGSGELRIQKLPLQLCNIGSYLMLYTLLKRSDRLFHFTVVVNVVGALIAIVMLDVEKKGFCYYWNIHYILEHSKVIIIPILCLLLKEFKPIKIKDYKDFFIGFSLYFAFVFIFGTISNGIYTHFNNDFFKVNTLFMFDSKIAGNLLPFAKALFDIKLSISIFTIYPIIQSLVYIVFLAFCSIIFFIIVLFSKKNKKTI